MRLWAIAFAGTALAHYAMAVIGVYETRAMYDLRWSAVPLGLVLLSFGWADYIMADRVSLSAAYPGSMVGFAIGAWHAIAILRRQVTRQGPRW